MPPHIIFRKRNENLGDIIASGITGYSQGRQLRRETEKEGLGNMVLQAQLEKLKQELTPVNEQDIQTFTDPSSGKQIPIFVRKPGTVRDYTENPLLPKPGTNINLTGIQEALKIFGGGAQPQQAVLPPGQQQAVPQQQGLPPEAQEGDVYRDDQTNETFTVKNGQLVRI